MEALQISSLSHTKTYILRFAVQSWEPFNPVTKLSSPLQEVDNKDRKSWKKKTKKERTENIASVFKISKTPPAKILNIREKAS